MGRVKARPIRDSLQIPPGTLPRWIVAYALSAVLILIGLITLNFMLRVISQER